MEKVRKIIFKGCTYSVIILLVFYLFGLISGISNAAIALPKFLLILSFGLLISLTDMIFDLPGIKNVVKYTIHYCVLLLSFIIVFIVSSEREIKSSGIFVAIFIFTLIYSALMLISRLIKRTTRIQKSNIASNTSESKATADKPKYTPIYRDEN